MQITVTLRNQTKKIPLQKLANLSITLSVMESLKQNIESNNLNVLQQSINVLIELPKIVKVPTANMDSLSKTAMLVKRHIISRDELVEEMKEVIEKLKVTLEALEIAKTRIADAMDQLIEEEFCDNALVKYQEAKKAFMQKYAAITFDCVKSLSSRETEIFEQYMFFDIDSKSMYSLFEILKEDLENLIGGGTAKIHKVAVNLG